MLNSIRVSTTGRLCVTRSICSSFTSVVGTTMSRDRHRPPLPTPPCCSFYSISCSVAGRSRTRLSRSRAGRRRAAARTPRLPPCVTPPRPCRARPAESRPQRAASRTRDVSGLRRRLIRGVAGDPLPGDVRPVLATESGMSLDRTVNRTLKMCVAGPKI